MESYDCLDAKNSRFMAIPPEIEDEILTYLETNYPPGNVYRRANLKIKDMPN